MLPVILTRTVQAQDLDAIALTQMPLAAGNLTLNGTLVQSLPRGYPIALTPVAVIGQQQYVAITSDADDSVNDFTVYGTNDQGIEIHETVTGPSSASVRTTFSFATVTRIEIDGAAAGNITAGIWDEADTLPIPMDIYVPNSTVQIAIELEDGTPSVSAEYTNDDYANKDYKLSQQGYTPPPIEEQGLLWWPHPSPQMNGAAANAIAVTIVPIMRALRFNINGDGTVRITIVQQSTQ